MNLFGFDPPELTEAHVAALAAERYGLVGKMHRLRGERSHNTLVMTADGAGYVMKVASAAEPRITIEFHAAALVHLERCAPHLPVARMIQSLDGELVPTHEHDGRAHAVRLVTHLPGVTFDDDQAISDDGLRRIGALVGEVSAALASFDHPAADTFMPWDIANGLILADDLWAGVGSDARGLLDAARERLADATELMRSLPRQIIHNDGHAGNLLRVDRSSDVVTGMIDFGDLVRTVTVADLGVSGANLVPHQRDPVGALAALAAGFDHHRRLTEPEIDALPELVLCRLVLSTLIVDHQIAHAPHISTSVAAERPGLLDGLERWLAVDPCAARERIREAR